MKKIIRKLLMEKIDLISRLKEMVDKYGFIGASKAIGGVKKLNKLIGDNLSDNVMIDAMKEVVLMEPERGIELYEMGLSPIHYNETDDETSDIEKILPDGILIVHYTTDFDDYDEIGDDVIDYDNLNSDDVKYIFKGLIHYYWENYE
jgi:hypothetical protein